MGDPVSAIENVGQEDGTLSEWAYKHFRREFIAGGLSGSVGIAVGFPFDLVKVRLQSNLGAYKTNLVRCFQEIYREGGLKGFYTGSLTPIGSQGFVNAVLFIGESTTLKILEPNLRSGESASHFNHFIAGCVGGLMSCAVTTPSDVVKCTMQATVIPIGTSHKPLSNFSATVFLIKDIYRSEGIGGFYKGFTATALRDVPSLGLYFWGYRINHELLMASGFFSRDIAIGLAGGCAGALSWTALYPFDVVKTHLQITPKGSNAATSTYFASALINQSSSSSSKSVSTLQMARYLYRTHGLPVFFRGLGVTVLRAFPVNGVTFSVYEQLKRKMNL